jgi:hypothetical protein
MIAITLISGRKTWFAKVDGPQISIANLQICGLDFFLDLRTFRKCGSLRIYNLRTIYFMQFEDWDTKEIWVFVICGLIITNLRFADWHTSEFCGFACQPLFVCLF